MHYKYFLYWTLERTYVFMSARQATEKLYIMTCSKNISWTERFAWEIQKACNYVKSQWLKTLFSKVQSRVKPRVGKQKCISVRHRNSWPCSLACVAGRRIKSIKCSVTVSSIELNTSETPVYMNRPLSTVLKSEKGRSTGGHDRYWDLLLRSLYYTVRMYCGKRAKNENT